jgi:ethanolamine utilization protein EutA (predicted chaperonin)
VTTDEGEGGRIFFSSTGRTLENEDEIVVLSVGVDIGSSTSHLVFSRILLERHDSRYIVTIREAFYESDILLTPYSEGETIDAAALGAFIEKQYQYADVDPDEIDTGALILTGVAVRRSNARAIGELFAQQAGKMVAVSAGDSLETTMAAYGSGAVARSIRDKGTVLNVDVGGGTSKIAVCVDGQVADLTALDVGARLICVDGSGRITRLEEAGRRFGAELGLSLDLGVTLSGEHAEALAARMADCLFEAMQGGTPALGGASLLRLDPLGRSATVDAVTFSGGVSEYIYNREAERFDDLGPLLAAAIRERVTGWGPRIEPPDEGIRATVIGASQYTTQVSGSTIYVSPLSVLPLRSVSVVAPALPLDSEEIDAATVTRSIESVLKRMELDDPNTPVAIFAPWRGSATFARIDAFCRGVAAAMAAKLEHGHALIVVGDGDVGGLIGIHFREELKLSTPVVSIDGLELKDFDFIDIGTILESSGAVPVVIKSLVFPASSAIGREGLAARTNGEAVASK